MNERRITQFLAIAWAAVFLYLCFMTIPDSIQRYEQTKSIGASIGSSTLAVLAAPLWLSIIFFTSGKRLFAVSLLALTICTIFFGFGVLLGLEHPAGQRDTLVLSIMAVCLCGISCWVFFRQRAAGKQSFHS